MISKNNIIISGIFFRFLVYSILIFFPFYHHSFGFVSPFTYQEFADLSFYKNFGETKFNLSNFIKIYSDIISFDFTQIDNRYPGPLFPLILKITSYNLDFTYFLSFLIFLTEISAFLIWSYGKFVNYSKFSIFVFAFMPIPLYFGFLHTTDVLFYLLFTLVYFEISSKLRIKYIVLFFILLLLIRPNSALIFLSCIIYFVIKKNNLLTVISFIFLIFSVFYYSPYFFYEINLLGISSTSIIANGTEQFFSGIYIYFKKVFYLLGFIPSDSGNIYFYFLRAACGVIFFIGLVHMFYKRDNLIDFIFVFCFIFVTASLFFPAYRYILPVTPILINYFSRVFFR